jgi:hypothetical protein
MVKCPFCKKDQDEYAIEVTRHDNGMVAASRLWEGGRKSVEVDIENNFGEDGAYEVKLICPSCNKEILTDTAPDGDNITGFLWGDLKVIIKKFKLPPGATTKELRWKKAKK